MHPARPSRGGASAVMADQAIWRLLNIAFALLMVAAATWLTLLSGCGERLGDDAGDSLGDTATSDAGEFGDGDGDAPDDRDPAPGDDDPEPIACGAGECNPGFGCTIAITCVDCGFVVGVYGCPCNISGECESTSVCSDGICSPY